MKKNLFLLLLLFTILYSCNTENTNSTNTSTEVPIVLADQLVMATLWTQKSAEMQAVYYQSYNLAKTQLEHNLAQLASEKKAAVVLDIDETVLDNSPYEGYLIQKGENYTSKSWKTWCELAAAPVLPGVSDFLHFADSIGVEVFYISNRRVNVLLSTVENLEKHSLPNADTVHVLLRTDERSKVNRRSIVEQNYEIILLIGDNLLDLSAEFEDRSLNNGFDVVYNKRELFGTKYIILPNPMYGDWESAIYGGNRPETDSAKFNFRKKVLNAFE